MDVVLRGSTLTENIGDRQMSSVATALFEDLGVRNLYRTGYNRRALRGLPDLRSIDAVFDLGNITYCDTWPKPLSLRLRKAIRFRCAVPKASFISLPCSWGPFQPTHRKLLDRLTRDAMIYARDHKSVHYVNELLGDERAIFCPDLAFMCGPQDPGIGQNVLSQLGLSLDEPILGIIPNSRCVEEGITPLSDPAKYYSHLRRVVSWARENCYQVVGISHMVNTDQDVKLLSDLGIPIVESNLPTIVRSVVANLSAAVCSRYHGLINCIVHGVPTISLGWHDKYPGVMNLVEMIEFDHPVNHDEEDLVSRLEVLSVNRPALIQRLQTNVGEVRSIIRTRMGELSTHLGGPPTVLNDLVTVDDTAVECLPEPKKRKGLRALLRHLR